jgi:hypothetical protein
MATQPKPTSIEEPAKHRFQANSKLLEADFREPIVRQVVSDVAVSLPGDGGYKFKRADPYRLEGLISYESGYVHVVGHRNDDGDSGYSTLATGVVEGLNVLDVITADRVVGQIATEHPDFNEDKDPVPAVSFLGTRFDNLRINGHEVEVDRHLHILGPKPDRRKSYFDDSGVLREISAQYSTINKAKNLPQWARDRYRWEQKATQKNGSMCCSLVRGVKGLPGPAITFGHVIEVPHVGKIFLGELKVSREKPERRGDAEKYTFHLTMIRLELGCAAHGSATILPLDSNGGGGHH